MSATRLPMRHGRQSADWRAGMLSGVLILLISITSCASLSAAPAPSPTTAPSQSRVVATSTSAGSSHTSGPTPTFVPVDSARSSAPTATFAPIPTSAPSTYRPIPTSTPTSTPTPTVTSTPTPAPTSTSTPAAGVSFSSLSSPVKRGGTARAVVATTPNTRCTIKVVYNGVTSSASGLGPKTSDGSGSVSWSWTVANSTPKGSWPVTVTCGGASATKYFAVQ